MRANWLGYPAQVFAPRRSNEQQDWSTSSAPPIPLPRSPAARNLALSLLWGYAAAEEDDGWVDRGELYREHAPLDPDDLYVAEEWLTEESLVVDVDVDEDGFARAEITPAGWSVLRWWGWEDVERVGNPSNIRAGDFIVIREPVTRRFHVLACGERDCLTLVGPQGGASSPSSAAMWARRIGGSEARVWLIEGEHMAFPISRAANALAMKERLRAV